MLRKIKTKFLVVLCVSCIGFSVFGASVNRKNENTTIGIISALPFETAYLKSQLKNVKIYRYFKRDYYEGELSGRNAVVVQVGIGVINAAVGTAILIDKFSPAAIILCGAAGGSIKTVPGDIIIGSKVTFYDLGMLDAKGKFSRLRAFWPDSPFSGNEVRHDPLFYKGSKALTDCIIKGTKKVSLKPLVYEGKSYKAKIVRGIITTSETFNEYPAKIREIMDTTGCIAFEMEGAGAAQVCYHEKVPFLMIKAISDTGNFGMFNALKKAAAKNVELLIEKSIPYFKKTEEK